MMDSFYNTIFLVSLGLIAVAYSKKEKKPLIKTEVPGFYTISGFSLISIILINLIYIPIALGILNLPYESTNISAPIRIVICLHIIFWPLLEELFFRRFLFHSIAKRWGISVGFFFSVILFSVLHIELINIIHTTLIGSLFTFLYIRTKSIVIPFLAHSFNNLLAYLNTNFDIPLFFIEFNSPWRYLEFVIALLLLLWSLRRIYQITRPRNQATTRLPNQATT